MSNAPTRILLPDSLRLFVLGWDRRWNTAKTGVARSVELGRMDGHRSQTDGADLSRNGRERQTMHGTRRGKVDSLSLSHSRDGYEILLQY